MSYKAYKFRIYPSKEQEIAFSQTAGCSRFVYNKLLELSTAEYEQTGKFILGYDLSNAIVGLKKEFPWLKEVNSQSLQVSAGNLASAFKNRFSKSRKKKAGFPKFKSKSGNISFAVPQHFAIKKNQIKLPKIGWISCLMHRKLEGKAKSLIIDKDVDAWFVSILCKLPDKDPIPFDKIGIVGIDLGLKTFAVTSDGEFIEAPDMSRQYAKLKNLQKHHAKKQKGSRNRDKARIKVARQYRKIRRITKNFIETTSAAIAKQYDVVSVEDLNIQGMKKNRRLSGPIQKVSWGAFVDALSRKMKVHKVSRWFPSSKTCSCCGWIKRDLTLADRTFVCDSCGFQEDRDLNAALNLRTAATAGFACGGDVRLDGANTKEQTPAKQEYEITGSQAVNASA